MKEKFEIEKSIEELESITDRLASGELSFEDSMKLYKKGMSLLKKTREQLDTYQNEIEVIDIEDTE